MKSFELAFSFRFYTNILTLFLRFESILVTLTASVPESGAATIFSIIEPFNSEVSAWSSIPFQTTSSTWGGWNCETTLEVFTLSFFDTIRATTKFGSITSTTSEVWPLGWRSSIRAAFEFCILTSTSL